MLVRFDPRGTRSLLAKMQKTPDLIPKLGKCPILGLGNALDPWHRVYFNYIVTRYYFAISSERTSCVAM